MSSALPDAAVIDTSVLLRSMLAEETDDDRRAADRLLTAWATGKVVLLTLDLCWYEFANVLVRQQRWPVEEVVVALDRVEHLALPLEQVDPSLVRAAASIAAQTGASAYDASFVVVARRLALPLLTADARLVHRLQSPEVRLLQDLA